MTVKTVKTTPSGGIVIPTTSDSYVKITITDDSDVVHTVMDTYGGAIDDNYVLSANIKKSVTSNLGSFNIKLCNIDGAWLNKFDGGELVRVYMDNTDATTLRFGGRIDNVTYGINTTNGFYVDINGRDYPELRDKTVTGTYVGATAGDAIVDILENNYTGLELQFWNGTEWATGSYNSVTGSVEWNKTVTNFPTTLININFQHKKGITVINEICNRAGLDSYISYSYYDGGGGAYSGQVDDTEYGTTTFQLRLFVKDSIVNNGANISYGVNLLSLNGFGINNNDIYNRIIVYGKTESDNILLVKTESDTDSQSNLWVKDKIITASDLSTMEEVQDKANYELSDGIDISPNGNITTICIPTMSPGDNIQVNIPYCNMNGAYRVQSYTHTFSANSIFKTNIQLVRKDAAINDILVQKINAEEFIGGISNPNAMLDSYNIYFNEDPVIVTLANATIVDGVTYIADGEIQGVVTSDIITADYDATKCELRRYENYYVSDDVYEVTNNGGDTWEVIDTTNGAIHTFANPGDKLGFRVTMNRDSASDPSPAYEALCLLYK